ncbi:hypothetical protein BC940DRAFT_303157 [Gongronella butleri]|nr:hypothetical protein BC940DRAFT_303157 [Gongronella butleri]
MYEPHLSPVAGNDPHNPMAMGAAAAVAGAGVGAMGADHANTTATEQPASNGGSLGVYAVIATYTPTLSDEIDIQHGDQIELIVEYDDGWCQGVNLTRGNAKGVFPRHCIAQYPGQQSSQSVSDHPPQVELSNLKRVSSMYMAYS